MLPARRHALRHRPSPPASRVVATRRPRGLRIAGPLVGKIGELARRMGTSPEAALKVALRECLERLIGPAPHDFKVRMALLKARHRRNRRHA